VVDPDDKSARVISWKLRHLKCTVIRAKSGSVGLSKASELGPDFIIVDALLPDFSAEDFYLALGSSTLPLVFVGALPEQERAVMDLGANVSVLGKPYDPDEVAETLGAALLQELIYEED